jgi:hypothetical protein
MKTHTLTRLPARETAPRTREGLLLRALSGDPDAALRWLERYGETASVEMRIAVFKAVAPKPAVTLMTRP